MRPGLELHSVFGISRSAGRLTSAKRQSPRWHDTTVFCTMSSLARTRWSGRRTCGAMPLPVAFPLCHRLRRVTTWMLQHWPNSWICKRPRERQIRRGSSRSRQTCDRAYRVGSEGAAVGQLYNSRASAVNDRRQHSFLAPSRRESGSPCCLDAACYVYNQLLQDMNESVFPIHSW